MSKRPSSTAIDRPGFAKTRPASKETAFQRSWQALPIDAQVLVRDFVFRKGVVTRCMDGEAMQVALFRFVPITVDPSAIPREFYWPCRATPLAQRDRVWVCERTLRTRSKGTDQFVLNHRKKANAVEDELDKDVEYEDLKAWLIAR